MCKPSERRSHLVHNVQQTPFVDHQSAFVDEQKAFLGVIDIKLVIEIGEVVEVGRRKLSVRGV